MTAHPRRRLLWLGTLLAAGCKFDNRRAIDLIAPDSLFPMEEEQGGPFQRTETGLEYRTLQPGNQRRRPKRTSTVTVHYRGWLDNGKEFDNSYSKGKPFTTKVTKVIPGWTEALLLMCEGEVMELRIPPHLAYGERGSPPTIPPNATLHFQVELLEVR